MIVADRISVMDHGRIVQAATPAEIYEAPRNRYVADFIGSVNLFEGQVETTSDERVRLVVPPGFVIDTVSTTPVEAGRPAWFAIRPEKVRISPQRPSDPELNAVEGEVWDIGYLGDMSVFNVRLDTGQIVRASMLNASRTVDRPISWEDRVWLSWADDAGVVLAG